jgi:DNA repair protein SbcC/Rad50
VQKTQRNRKGKLDQAKQSLDETQTTFDQVQKQLEAINQEIQQIALDESDRLNILQQVLGLLPTQRTLGSEVGIAISNLDSATSATLTAQQTVQQTTLALEQANTALAEARQALQQAISDNAVAALRQSLSEGDSCPVCQGLYPGHHLLSDVSTVDLARLEKTVSQTETLQHQAQQKSTQAKSVLASHETKQATCQQELEAKKVKLSENCAAIASILQVEQWQVDSLEKEHQVLQAKDEAYRKALSKQEKAEMNFNAKQQSLQFAQQVHSTASEEYEQANTDLADRTQQYQEIEGQLDSALSSLYQTLGKQPYQALKQSIEQQRQEFDAVLNTVRNAFGTAEKQLVEVTENHRNAQQAVQESHEIKNIKEQEWSNKLELAGFSESEFLTAQVSATQQTDWQNQLDTYRQNKIQLETRIEEVTALISDKTTSEEAIAQRRQAMQADISQKSEAEVQHRELFGWLKQVESDRQKAETLVKQQETYAEQRDLHKTLANNLKSDEFQDYILEQFQEELTSQASTFLQDLTQRYSLTLENGKYRVRDGWNGDEARNLKTLSGGETFLSSLAMGLALSEKMARGTEIGSLFLDEGFGTLDAEALESVASALESLRGQHRLVGVITHVEDLADRIQTQVRVIKAPDGSRLEMIHS